jgi:hypothetical protein
MGIVFSYYRFAASSPHTRLIIASQQVPRVPLASSGPPCRHSSTLGGKCHPLGLQRFPQNHSRLLKASRLSGLESFPDPHSTQTLGARPFCAAFVVAVALWRLSLRTCVGSVAKLPGLRRLMVGGGKGGGKRRRDQVFRSSDTLSFVQSYSLSPTNKNSFVARHWLTQQNHTFYYDVHVRFVIGYVLPASIYKKL